MKRQRYVWTTREPGVNPGSPRQAKPPTKPQPVPVRVVRSTGERIAYGAAAGLVGGIAWAVFMAKYGA